MTRALRVVEVSAWVLGVIFLAKYGDAMFTQLVRAPRDVERFFISVAHAQSAAATALPVIDVPDQTQWSNTRRDAYRTSLAHPAPRAIAVLRVPAARIEVPVYEGTSDAVLDRGAGWITTTARVEDGGNIGIAAHRDSYFRALKDVKIGDYIELQMIGEVRRFRVAYTRIVEPSDTSSLRLTDEDAVTLVTCYPFYYVGHAPQRYIVRAVEESAGNGNSNVGESSSTELASATARGDAP